MCSSSAQLLSSQLGESFVLGRVPEKTSIFHASFKWCHHGSADSAGFLLCKSVKILSWVRCAILHTRFWHSLFFLRSRPKLKKTWDFQIIHTETSTKRQATRDQEISGTWLTTVGHTECAERESAVQRNRSYLRDEFCFETKTLLKLEFRFKFGISCSFSANQTFEIQNCWTCFSRKKTGGGVIVRSVRGNLMSRVMPKWFFAPVKSGVCVHVTASRRYSRLNVHNSGICAVPYCEVQQHQEAETKFHKARKHNASNVLKSKTDPNCPDNSASIKHPFKTGKLPLFISSLKVSAIQGWSQPLSHLFNIHYIL